MLVLHFHILKSGMGLLGPQLDPSTIIPNRSCATTQRLWSSGGGKWEMCVPQKLPAPGRILSGSLQFCLYFVTCCDRCGTLSYCHNCGALWHCDSQTFFVSIYGFINPKFIRVSQFINSFVTSGT
jgi:hypothetical protein